VTIYLRYRATSTHEPKRNGCNSLAALPSPSGGTVFPGPQCLDSSGVRAGGKGCHRLPSTALAMAWAMAHCPSSEAMNLES